MNDQERAVAAYESALRHNPYSEHTLTLVATLCRSMEKYPKVSLAVGSLMNIIATLNLTWIIIIDTLGC